jgi:hypothetical protein
MLQQINNVTKNCLPCWVRGWVMQMMMIGGRVQMVNIVLSAISNFFMAFIE